MNSFRFTVSLRFFSEVVAPEEIAARLGREPRILHKMGEPRRTPKGLTLEGTYSKHYCSFEFKPEVNEALEDLLSRIVDDLAASRDLFLRVSATGGTSEFFIGWFSVGNSGSVLSHRLLERLGQLRIDLALDVYAEAGEVSPPSSPGRYDAE